MDQCYPGARAAVNAYLDANPETVVVTVDGNDLDACHTDFKSQLDGRVDVHFAREPVGAEWKSHKRPYAANFKAPRFTPPLP